MKKITLPLICFVGILFIVVATALIISEPRFRVALSGTDFRGQYTGALMVTRGIIDTLYSTGEQFKWQKHFLPELTQDQLMVFSYYPLVALFLSPLGLLSFGNAYRIALAVNVGLMLYTIRLNARLLTVRSTHDSIPALYAVYTFFLPVWFALLQNQFSFLLYIMFYYLWKWVREKKYARAGLLLSAFIIKPHMLVVPLLVLAATGNRKIVTWFAAGFTAIVISTVVIFGKNVLLNYFSFLMLLSKAGDSYTIHTADEPTIKGLLHFALHTDKLPPWAIAVYGVLFLAFIARLIFLRKRAADKSTRLDLWFGAIILATLITSPHTNYHDLLLILFSVIMLLRFFLDKPSSDKLRQFPVQKKLTWYLLCFAVFILTAIWVFYPPVATLTMFVLFVTIDYVIRHGHLYAFTKRSMSDKK